MSELITPEVKLLAVREELAKVDARRSQLLAVEQELVDQINAGNPPAETPAEDAAAAAPEAGADAPQTPAEQPAETATPEAPAADPAAETPATDAAPADPNAENLAA